jgi:hypothetical protein
VKEFETRKTKGERKMKKRIFTILAAMALAVTIPANVLAAEPETLPEPGLIPGHSFYFMETWMQRLNMAFTSGPEAKLQKALHYAGEKLAEIETLAEQNQTGNMEQSVNQYRYYLSIAERNMEKAMAGDNGTGKRIAMMMAYHIGVMTENQNKGDDGCQQIREQAMAAAEGCQESTVRTLARQNAVEAIRLNLTLMEQQCIRMENCIGQEANNQLGEELQQYERLREMNREMATSAGQSGFGPEVEQMIQAAEAYQNTVMSQVRNRVQTEAGGIPEEPVQNQTQEQNQSGPENYGEPDQEQNGSDIGYGGGSGSGSGQKP